LRYTKVACSVKKGAQRLEDESAAGGLKVIDLTIQQGGL
jgi:hypothetical protein